MKVDSLILQYREAHPRCKFCQYYKWHTPRLYCPSNSGADFATCELKDKILKTNLLAIFCNYYNVKG